MRVFRPFFIALACVVFFGVIMISPIFQIRLKWPTVAEPAALIEECRTLLRDYDGNIPRDRWSQHLASLHPIMVTAIDHDYLQVMTSKGGMGSPWGYIIFADQIKASNLSSTNKDWTRTTSPMIFKFQ